MNEICKNCGRVWQPNRTLYPRHYICVQVERGNMTADALWVKLQTGGKPNECDEWCDKSEVGDDEK